jgi:predicted SnoaL-like aldol condensation-catalyzing enzyme
MSQSTAARNKAIVLEAFDTLFNERDYAAAARFWSPNYVQHSAHIEPGRDGLFNLIKSMPPTFKHEHEQIVADGELVIVHSRFSGFGQAKNWIVADFVRVVDGLLVEHWDVVEDEASGGRLQERAADVRRSLSSVAAPHQWVEAVWPARGPGSTRNKPMGGFNG